MAWYTVYVAEKNKTGIVMQVVDMEKLMLSADGDIMLYEVDKRILDDFDNLIERFYQWKKTNCYDEQLFVEFLQQRYGNKAIRFIKNLGWIYYNLPKEYENVKWYNF